MHENTPKEAKGQVRGVKETWSSQRICTKGGALEGGDRESRTMVKAGRSAVGGNEDEPDQSDVPARERN